MKNKVFYVLLGNMKKCDISCTAGTEHFFHIAQQHKEKLEKE